MIDQQMVMYEEEFRQVASVCEHLQREANARAVLLVDRNGQYITAHGDVGDLDTTSLASLTAGNVAAMSGMAKLIGEREFSNVFHEGEKEKLHLSMVSNRAILVVMFDHRSSLGLVRLRVKKSSEELAKIFAVIVSKSQGSAQTPLQEISEADIDNLFSE